MLLLALVLVVAVVFDLFTMLYALDVLYVVGDKLFDVFDLFDPIAFLSENGSLLFRRDVVVVPMDVIGGGVPRPSVDPS